MIIIIIITFIVISIIYFYYFNKNKSNELIVKNINTIVSFPSLLVLNTNAKYTTIINDKNDKLLLTYIDKNNSIKYTYLDVFNCQLLDYDNKIQKLFTTLTLENLILFSFNYCLYLLTTENEQIKIISVQTKQEFLPNIKNAIFFSNNNNYALSSLSPLIIYKLNNNNQNFNINNDDIIINNNWNNNKPIKLTTTPIFINDKFYIMGIDENKQLSIFIFNSSTFDYINKIYVNNHTIPSGFLFNNLTNEFYICLTTNKSNIKIIKIKNDI